MITYKMCYCNHSPQGIVLKPIEEIRLIKIDELYKNIASIMDRGLERYSNGEMETWSKMNDECVEYKKSGIIGSLMAKKIASSPIYNTADKLADMTIAEYMGYITKKYNLEAQRDQHKLNINSITDINDLINYDISVIL